MPYSKSVCQKAQLLELPWLIVAACGRIVDYPHMDFSPVCIDRLQRWLVAVLYQEKRMTGLFSFYTHITCAKVKHLPEKLMWFVSLFLEMEDPGSGLSGRVSNSPLNHWSSWDLEKNPSTLAGEAKGAGSGSGGMGGSGGSLQDFLFLSNAFTLGLTGKTRPALGPPLVSSRRGIAHSGGTTGGVEYFTVNLMSSWVVSTSLLFSMDRLWEFHL